MDFLHFDPEHRILACTLCQYALVPAFLLGHLQDHHCKQLKPRERLELRQPLRSAAHTGPSRRRAHPAATIRAAHPLFRPLQRRICCRLCTGERPYVCRNKQVMIKHLSSVHKWKRKRG
jgi:hypothetical protein